MNEGREGCGAHHNGDCGIWPGQTVPADESEGHGSDVAASFAKPTSPEVIPGHKLDHDYTDTDEPQE
jgi:hypothetical protein